MEQRTAQLTRDELLSGIKRVRARINDVLVEAKEKARIFEQFKEEKRILTAQNMGALDIGRFVVITVIALASLLGLIAGNSGILLSGIIGVVLYLVAPKLKGKLRTISYIAAFALMAYVVATLFFNYRMHIVLIIISLIIIAAVVVAEVFILKAVNKKRASDNAGIRAFNEENQALYDETVARFNKYAKELNQYMAAINYPPDYCNLDAADYFISTIRNSRADTMKEAVNLYVDELRHRENAAQLASIRDEQRVGNELLRQNNTQLRLLNAISAANYIQNVANGMKLDNLNSSVQRNTSALNMNTASNNRIADSLNRLRRR